MENTKIIEATISTKTLRKDKFNRDYLILKLDNDEKIFVFPSQLNPAQWDYLTEGNNYQFTVKESSQGSNLLVDFK